MATAARSLMALSLAAGLLIGLAGCGGKAPPRLALTGGGGPPQLYPNGVESHTVELRNWRFDAATVIIKAGTTLRFRNRDPFAHAIQAAATAGAAPTFTSGEIAPGAIWASVFPTAGTYDLTCVATDPSTLLQGKPMRGTVVVQ